MGVTSRSMAGSRSSGLRIGVPSFKSRSTAGQRRTVGATLAATTRHPAFECVIASPTLAIAWARRPPTFSKIATSYSRHGMRIATTSWSGRFFICL